MEKLKGFLKKNGLAFVIIFVGWEIVEDVVFPIIFGALGNYVHPAFYAGIPASLILMFSLVSYSHPLGFMGKADQSIGYVR